jgi:hypothetical protein
MKQTGLPSFLSHASLLLFFYCLILLQLSNPLNPAISVVSIIFYAFIYRGIRHHPQKTKTRELVIIAAFTFTFTAFWLHIIQLILYLADVLPNTNPLHIIIISALYLPLFILFYNAIQNPPEKPYDPTSSEKTLHFILEITFPIITAICIFITTLLLYAFLLRIRVETITHELSGINILLSTSAVTIITTVLTSYLFGKWLQTAGKRSMQKLLIIFTSIGFVLTIILTNAKIT